MINVLLRLTLMIVLLCVGIATAKTIYKSKDAQGNVVFSDVPQNMDSESLTVKSGPSEDKTSSSAPSSETRSSSEQTEDEGLRSGKKQMTLREQIEKNCEIYRKNLEILKKQEPVFSVNAEGEREFFSDERRAKEIATLQENIEDYCQ